MNLFEFFKGHFTTGNHRLIRNNDCQITGSVNHFDCIRNAVYQFKLVYVPKETHIFIDSAVPIKEHCFLLVLQILTGNATSLVILAYRIIAFGCSHILHIFRTIVAEHLSGSGQRLKKLSIQINLDGFSVLSHSANLVRINPRMFQNARINNMKPCIDTIMIVFRSFIFLSQPLLDSPIFISNNESAVVGMAIWMREKSNQTAMLLMKDHEPIEIHIEHSISIQQQKIRIQLILDFEKRTGITQWFLLKIVFNMNTERLSCCRRYTRTISEIVHDDVSEMRNGQNNVCESLVTQTLQLTFQNRLSFDFYHRLGDITGNRGNPGAPAACHYYCFHLRPSSLEFST